MILCEVVIQVTFLQPTLKWPTVKKLQSQSFAVYCTDDAGERRFEVTVSVDDVGFPLQNALFAGQPSLNAAAACYVRYKFYDRSTPLS